jgi:hypothetical protein
MTEYYDGVGVRDTGKDGYKDATLGTIDYGKMSDPDYLIGRRRGKADMDMFRGAGINAARGLDPSAAMGMLVLAGLFFVAAGGYWCYLKIQAGMIRGLEGTVEHLRHYASPMTEADADRLFVQHPFGVYAAYAPNYEQYRTWIKGMRISETDAMHVDALSHRRLLLNSDDNRIDAAISAVRSHGENSPEYIGLLGAAWSICLETNCSFTMARLGFQFLRKMEERNLPQAYYDMQVASTSWHKGKDVMSNERVLRLSPGWAKLAKRFPGNAEIDEVDRLLNPNRHGLFGYVYVRLLKIESSILHSYDPLGKKSR